MADPAMMAAEPVAAPASAAGDLSQGYCIELSVLPDGSFKVSGPAALEAEAVEETGAPGSELGQDLTTIGDALKAIIGIVKENPVGADDQKQFEAGYGAR
jgi:hypothetical protein